MNGALTATVKKSTGSWYQLLTQEGKIIEARTKGKLRLQDIKVTNPVAVGDQVEYELEGAQAVIKNVLPRENYLIRRSNNLSRQAQIIASNLDQMAIIATLAAPRTSTGFIDRLLVNAEAYEIPAVILFNKRDTLTPEGFGWATELVGLYNGIGYPSWLLSFKMPTDVDKVRDLFRNKTTLVTGHSGVGKSTLLNQLIPSLELKTAQISLSSMKGKHTTTFAEMHLMEGSHQSRVIDTPGIKDFGVIDFEKAEIGHCFPEFRPFLPQCRFNNCLHLNEPDCAVLPQVGLAIPPSRYHSYLSILKEEDTYA